VAIAVPPEPEVLDGCRAAHRTLLSTLEALTNEDVGQPSRLPSWTRGHVLAHLARNAESHARVLRAARDREAVDRYPGGAAQRTGEIEAGAARPAAEQVADVTATIAALEQVWSELDEAAWHVVGTSIGRPEPAATLPWRRWREVEVHHADLGLAFTWRDWSSGYVRRELREAEMAWRASKPMGLTGLPAAAQQLDPPSRLAWLMGRLTVEGLPSVPQWF
jgi:maleylpyruvate isomerase